MPNQRLSFSLELWNLLISGQMSECRLTPVGSNYTFYATLSNSKHQPCSVVYKPQDGEAPLWDFPDGTLYLREHAAYVLSEALGWGFIPPTIVRYGPHGIGSVQIYIESDPMANYFTLYEKHRHDFMRICTFDIVANNADRKASHCLLGTDGCIWVIDHGITFHSQHKLRTVVWDFAGEQIPYWILEDLNSLISNFTDEEGLRNQLGPFLRCDEIAALRHRVEHLLEHPFFPFPGPGRSIPWPWF